MNQVLISVILPVYGVERYIGACIESLKAQRQEGLEFLFVDDCSPDGSAALIEAFAAEDSRVRLLRQPVNGGAGVARNAGIAAARGEYLSFVDPDDWLDPEFYSLLWAAASAHPDWDIIKGVNVCTDDRTGERVTWWEGLNKRIRSQLSKGTPLYLTPFYDHFTALYRASLFADPDIRYGKGRNGEDTTFLLRVCLKTQRIGFEDRAIYYYRGQRPGALTTIFTERRLESELNSLEEKLETICARMEHLDKHACRYLRQRFGLSIIHYCAGELQDPALKVHEDRYRAHLRALMETLPNPEAVWGKMKELQLLLRYDVMVPPLKEDFHAERCRRWTNFAVEYPEEAKQYATGYAVMLLQCIRSRLTNPRCDLRRSGFFKTVVPQWRRLKLSYRLRVLFYMFWLPARSVVLGTLCRVGLRKPPDSEETKGE